MEISLGEAITTAQGVGRGDQLAVFSLDSHRNMEIVLAALKLGAVIRLFVALNSADSEGDSGYEALLATGTEDEPPVIAGDADVIGLASTSGTTGLPVNASGKILKRELRTRD
jgi:acyl-coenzyme A synthetase/AMP-(fatty) acid ligase